MAGDRRAIAREGYEPEDRAGGRANPLATAALVRHIKTLQRMPAHGGYTRPVDWYSGNLLHGALGYTTAECWRELLAQAADACDHPGLFGNRARMHVVARYDDGTDGPERVRIRNLLLFRARR
jgi:hypothetical protein